MIAAFLLSVALTPVGKARSPFANYSYKVASSLIKDFDIVKRKNQGIL